MQTVRFIEDYSHIKQSVDCNSPEIRFMKHICEGGCTVENYFNEVTLYRAYVFLDSPNGRFEKLNGIRVFAQKWLSDFNAEKGEVHPVVQTVANGRSVTELEIWFRLKDSFETKRVPMTIFADLAPQNKMEGMRIYYFFKFLPGAIPYRVPVYKPRIMKPTETVLMSGVMRYYYEQLHNFRAEALDNIMDMLTDDCIYGGYRPYEDEPTAKGKNQIRPHYEEICSSVPHLNYIRFETIVDDGVRMAAEWTSIVTSKGRAAGRTSFCGCAVYDRDVNGKISSIRINDNAGYDPGIDLNSINAWDNFIDD